MSSSANDALNDELEALTSIYDSSVLTILPPSNNTTASSPTSASESTSAIIALPNVAYTFSTTFPPDYPDSPPQILGTHHVDASVKKGQGDIATVILRDVLGRVYTPGQVCLFDLIEEAMPLLTQHHDEQQQQRVTEDSLSHENDSAVVPNTATSCPAATHPSSETTKPHHQTTKTRTDEPEPRWILSEQLIVNKSTFVARCLSVNDLSEAKASVGHLLATNRRVAAATHNITAWRIRQVQVTQGESGAGSGGGGGPEITIQDCDDDGETAAGGRLLHLLQLMDVWNVLVVVTRWYGGVKLGPDRFRCINAVAREALVNAGFTGGSEKSGAAKKGKKS